MRLIWSEDMTKYFFGLIGVALFGTPAFAETMEQCMSRKVDALRDKKTELVISDRGCTTGGTEFVVKFDYQGFKTHECSENVCWTSPPDRLILDANATDASAAARLTAGLEPFPRKGERPATAASRVMPAPR
jgi:hypothetical protein